MFAGWFAAPEARLALSLLLGLMLGVERERRKLDPNHATNAGLRTFALVGLLGGLAAYSGLPHAIVIGLGVIGALVTAGYALHRDEQVDAGLTTEVAVVLTYALGALCLTKPGVAGAAAIASALLLHLRTPLHRFVRNAIRDDEVHDALLLLLFAFVALPLAPDRGMGPYSAINPQAIARLMVLIGVIGSAGYVAQRLLGSRLGFVASGLASGLVSSSATIAALGLRAKSDPRLAGPAAAGAVASSIATVLLYAVLLFALDLALLQRVLAPFGLALAAAVIGSALLARKTLEDEKPAEAEGRAFQLLPMLLIGGGSALIAVLAAALGDVVGDAGIVVVSSIAGLIDAHATTGTVGALHRGEQITTSVAELAVLGAFTSNTLTKIVIAGVCGPLGYALRVGGAVLGMTVVAWLGFALLHLPG